MLHVSSFKLAIAAEILGKKCCAQFQILFLYWRESRYRTVSPSLLYPQGDVAETCKTFFEQSSLVPPCKTSTLTLAEVDTFLDRMTLVTKEEDQKTELTRIIRR